jgi:protein-S-isoprenylcysteine O-methyltransferase Ste14
MAFQSMGHRQDADATTKVPPPSKIAVSRRRPTILRSETTPVPIELPPHQDRPGVPIAPPLLFVLPILASIPLEWFFPTSFAQGYVRWICATFLVAFGVALTVVGFVTQRRAGTDPIPFKPTTRIVSHGLYRFSRNPMYIGFAFCTLGLAILVDSEWMLLAVPIGLALTDLLVVVREERYLEKKFGEEYVAYKGRVRRWI